ncbi:MAG: hypothetical protein HYX31_03795 [Mycobacterium sp.]|jgi:hypothetical protein|nr:hypothetical protein [Mycobacterium sp.]
MRESPDERQPEFRHLRIYAIDPMVSRTTEHQATVQIRFEKLQFRGENDKKKTRNPVSFMGDRIEVVDVDAAGEKPVWLKPVDLDDAHIAMQHGLEPSESDPQFHQQMVYAVAMRTIEQFDRALGRRFYFRGRRRLRLVPHAFQGGNAFYDPDIRAVLFGYFRASIDAPGDNLPGQLIFTCLSHDIVAHEVTHAIVDKLRPSFNVATNPHVRAFHEGFSDIVAMFQRLSYRDLVQRALQESKGDLREAGSLQDIAAQFGQGLGSGKALRKALERDRRPTKITDVSEEHALGEVLVSAIFEGFYTTYERRTSDLIRIATGGTGVLPKGDVHPDLIARLTSECVRTAQSVLTMCIRAFDYLPPADVTFGTFLRALVTADWELNPLDEAGLRAAIIDACRKRGIFAVEAGSLAVNALLLDRADERRWKHHERTFRDWVDLAVKVSIEEQREETPDGREDPAHGALVRSTSLGQVLPARIDTGAEPDRELVDSGRQLRKSISDWFNKLRPSERQHLGFLPNQSLTYPIFDLSRRVTSDGATRFGLVVQLIQTQVLEVAGKDRKLPSGVTLVIDVTGQVRFVIGAANVASRRQDSESRLKGLEKMARVAMTDAMGWQIDDTDGDPFAVDYQGMHEARR